MKQLFLCIVTMLLFVKTTSQSIATDDFSYFELNEEQLEAVAGGSLLPYPDPDQKALEAAMEAIRIFMGGY